MSSKTTSIYFGEVSQRVGKKAPANLGKVEWGEIYHAAAFLAADSAHKVFFIRPNSETRDRDKVLDFLRMFPEPEFSRNVIVVQSVEDAKARKGDGEAEGMAASAERFLYLASSGVDVQTIIRNRFRKMMKLSDPDSGRPMDQPNRCFLWIRYKDDEETGGRNMNKIGFDQICGLLDELKVKPVFIGNKADFAEASIENPENLIEFWNLDGLKDDPAAQLKFLVEYARTHNVRFSIGMKSGGMDGLCFGDGLPTFFIESGKPPLRPKKRMEYHQEAFPSFRWVEARFTVKKRFDGFSCDHLKKFRTQIEETFRQTKLTEGKQGAFGQIVG